MTNHKTKLTEICLTCMQATACVVFASLLIVLGDEILSHHLIVSTAQSSCLVDEVSE